MDHIIPPSSAGEPGTEKYEQLLRDPRNWQPACGQCNRIKGNRSMSHPVVQALLGEASPEAHI